MTTVSRTANNMIQNGSFEEGETSWTFTSVAEVSTSSYKYGTHSALLLSEGGTVPEFKGIISQNINIRSKHFYYISFWGKYDSVESSDVPTICMAVDGSVETEDIMTSSYTLYSTVYEASATGLKSLSLYPKEFSSGINFTYLDGILVVDLTVLYGYGNEPLNPATFDAIVNDNGGWWDEGQVVDINIFLGTAEFTNALINGSFESGSSSWTTSGTGTVTANDTTHVYNGNYDIKITSAGDSTATYIYQTFSQTSQRIWYLGYYGYGDGGTTACQIRNSTGAITYLNINESSGYHSRTLTLGGSGTYRFYFGTSSDSSVNNYYYDRIVLIDLTTAFGAGCEPSSDFMDGIIQRRMDDYLMSTKQYAYTGTELITPENMLTNGSFENSTTGWSTSGTISFSVNSAYYHPYGSYGCMLNKNILNTDGYIYQNITVKSNHKYLITAKGYGDTGTYSYGRIGISMPSPSTDYYTNTCPSTAGRFSVVATAPHSGTAQIRAEVKYLTGAGGSSASMYFDGIMCIDLTETFGSGNEPSSTDVESYIDWIQYESNTGGWWDIGYPGTIDIRDFTNVAYRGDFEESDYTSHWTNNGSAAVARLDTPNQSTLIPPTAPDGSYIFEYENTHLIKYTSHTTSSVPSTSYYYSDALPYTWHQNHRIYGSALTRVYFSTVPVACYSRVCLINPTTLSEYGYTSAPTSGVERTAVIYDSTGTDDLSVGVKSYNDPSDAMSYEVVYMDGFVLLNLNDAFGDTYGDSITADAMSSIIGAFNDYIPTNLLESPVLDSISAVRNSSQPCKTDITIVWDAVVDAASYNIYRSTTVNSPWAFSLYDNTVDLTYTDSAQGGGTSTGTYYYKITALDEWGAGESLASNVLDEDLFENTTNVPGETTAAQNGAYSSDGGVTYYPSNKLTVSASADIPTGITYTKAQYRRHNSSGTVLDTSNELTISASGGGTVYLYDQAGNIPSAPSNGGVYKYSTRMMSACGIWSDYGAMGGSTITSANVPGVPTVTTLTSSYTSTSYQAYPTITINWTAPTTNGVPVTYYKVEFSINGSTWTTASSTVSAGVATYTFNYSNGLALGTKYYVRISANSLLGYGNTSSSSSWYTTTPNIPSAPVITGTETGVRDDACYITFYYTASTSNGSYIIDYRLYGRVKNVGSYTLLSTVGSSFTEISADGLLPNTTYQLYMICHANLGNSVATAVYEITTNGQPTRPVTRIGIQNRVYADVNHVKMCWVPSTTTITKVYNNMVSNGGFDTNSTSGWWSLSGGSLNTISSVGLYTGDAYCAYLSPGAITTKYVYQTFYNSMTTGHVYYVTAFMKVSAVNEGISKINIRDSTNVVAYLQCVSETSFTKKYTTFTATSTTMSIELRAYCDDILEQYKAYYDGIMMIDLTEIYGAGYEPTASEMNTFITENGIFWDGSKTIISIVGDIVDITGYHIYRSEDEETYTLVGDVTDDDLTYYDTDIEPNTKYYYKIVSYNDLGEGPE